MTQEILQALSEEELSLLILNSGAVTIKDVDGGEQAYKYTSGHFGPGYIDIKGTVGKEDIFKILAKQSALKLIEEQTPFDFIAAIATGGMTPGYQVREYYEEMTGKKIPYIYLKDLKDKGVDANYSVGLRGNPLIPLGSKPLIFEELVNFATTVSLAKRSLSNDGYICSCVATILNYENPRAIAGLEEEKLNVISLVRLKILLQIAEDSRMFPKRAVDSFRSFLQNPVEWQQTRGLKGINN